MNLLQQFQHIIQSARSVIQLYVVKRRLITGIDAEIGWVTAMDKCGDMLTGRETKLEVVEAGIPKIESVYVQLKES